MREELAQKKKDQNDRLGNVTIAEGDEPRGGGDGAFKQSHGLGGLRTMTQDVLEGVVADSTAGGGGGRRGGGDGGRRSLGSIGEDHRGHGGDESFKRSYGLGGLRTMTQDVLEGVDSVASLGSTGGGRCANEGSGGGSGGGGEGRDASQEIDDAFKEVHGIGDLRTLTEDEMRRWKTPNATPRE